MFGTSLYVSYPSRNVLPNRPEIQIKYLSLKCTLKKSFGLTEHILWQFYHSESVAKHHQKFFPKLPSWSLDWQRPHSRTSQRHSRYSQVKKPPTAYALTTNTRLNLESPSQPAQNHYVRIQFLYNLLSFWCSGAASFRELGPPDLCHVVKTSGRQGAREVGGISSIIMAWILTSSVRFISLRLRSRCFFFRVFGRVYQFPYLCHWRQYRVVLKVATMEGEKWLLLVNSSVFLAKLAQFFWKTIF